MIEDRKLKGTGIGNSIFKVCLGDIHKVRLRGQGLDRGELDLLQQEGGGGCLENIPTYFPLLHRLTTS